jgi:ketosteroid isomerase-like protein
MMRNFSALVLVVVIAISDGGAAQGQDSTDQKAVRGQVQNYVESINKGDTALGARVWATTPDVSFIHPRGTERGWEQVKQNFYEKTMGPFTERTLKVVGDVAVHTYGKAATAIFEWDFVARMKDGTPIHTTGRETQVYAKLVGGDWRLVHVHYSGMPVTANREGF